MKYTRHQTGILWESCNNYIWLSQNIPLMNGGNENKENLSGSFESFSVCKCLYFKITDTHLKVSFLLYLWRWKWQMQINTKIISYFHEYYTIKIRTFNHSLITCTQCTMPCYFCFPRISQFLRKNQIVCHCSLKLENNVFIIMYIKNRLTWGKMLWTLIPWREVLLRNLMVHPASK
jgi:hypothetical protein